MPFIRSISGLRATLGDELTPSIVADYSTAFASFCPIGKIIVGYDGRPSGDWISSIVCSSLIASGREVVYIGMVPTPTVQFIIESKNAAGGIVITASHNDERWNGLKFLNSKGIFLNKEENARLFEFADRKSFTFAKSNYPKIEYYNSAIDEHINKILEIEPLVEQLDFINQKKYKIVLDAVNASGSFAIQELLKLLNCSLIPLYADGSGLFPHNPEPLPINLTQLSEKVKSEDADIGIAVDPDADRLVLIDNKGEPIGEELTIAIAIDSVFGYYFGKKELIGVINFSTSSICEEIAKKYNAKIFRSPVGEINVVSKMQSTGAIIGGEGSGGVILPACHYGRDSLVGIALLLALLSRKNQSISELVNEYPKLFMTKYKQFYDKDINLLLDKIKTKMSEFEINTEDGFYLTKENCSVQLRKSNTEPIIRIIAESKDEKITLALIERIKTIIHNE